MATVTLLSFLFCETGTTLKAVAIVSLTSSVSSAGIVVSASLMTFMPSCSPSALRTWSSLTRPSRTATLPSSSSAGALLLLEDLPELLLVEVAHVHQDLCRVGAP